MTDTPTATQTDVLRGTWTIDPVHSSLEFSARHAMVTIVRGKFTEFSGTITIDPDQPSRSSVEVEVDPTAITTHNPDRDAHLRSADFLEIEKYPTLTFKSSRVERGDDPDRFTLYGDLVIKGVSREIALDMTFNGIALDPWGKNRAGFEGGTTINRKDWGVSFNVPLEAGGVLVSEKVKLTIEVAAVKQ